MNYLNFKKSESKKIELGTTIKYTYYIYNNICIKILKIGKSRKKYSIYNNWNSEIKAGNCIHYDIDKKDINSLLSDIII